MTESRTKRAAAVLFAAAFVGLLVAPGAGARVRETQFFTINVKRASASSPSLFLGASGSRLGAPVTLQTYQSGNRFQQWTPVWRTYPEAPEITGGSPIGPALEDFFGNCFLKPWPIYSNGCGFAAPTEPRYPLKFVNRATGMCLAVPSGGPTYRPPAYGDGTPALQGRCVGSPPNARFFQTWSTERVQGANRTESTLWQFHFKPRCLDVKDFREVAGTPLQMWQCHGGTNWNQQFRFLGVAQARCEVGITNKICGVPGSPPDV